MVSAETVDGGKLRQAATRKSDQSILVQIADKDLIALEVKYHKRCYQTRRFLGTAQNSRPKNNMDASMKNPSMIFCEDFVKTQIIEEENVFYIKKLIK